MAVTPTELIGRERELARLFPFVAGDRVSRHALLIEGDAGIGKTSLWLAAVAAAENAGSAVHRSRPAEAETGFAFSALGDLLEGEAESGFAKLPDPQRRALEAALLLRDAETEQGPAPGAVAAAFLSALRVLARRGRLLVAVDDLQWLDAGSAGALAYALRRIAPDEGVRFLLARRAGSHPERHAEIVQSADPLTLGPLSFGAIQSVVRARVDASLSRLALRRVYEASAGNPFFALEFAAALVRAGGQVTPSGELTVPDSLLGLLADRLARLSGDTERAALAVALAGEASRERIFAAVGSESAVDDALDAGVLVEQGPTLRLAHPLIGSAVRRRAPPGVRNTLHAALAETARSSEEAARHRSLAATPPDERVAGMLDTESLRARARGALVASVELAEQAVGFTSDQDPAHLAQRRLDLADRLSQLGDWERAAEQLETALPELSRGNPRAHALHLLAESQRSARFDVQAWDEALAEPGIDDAMRARLLTAKAGESATSVSHVDRALPWAREAVELARRIGDPVLEAFCAEGVAWAEALGGETARTLPAAPLTFEESMRVCDHPARVRALSAMWRGELPTARAGFEALLAEARTREEEWSIFVLSVQLFELSVREGDVTGVLRAKVELELGSAGLAGTAPANRRAAAFVAALTGNVGEARTIVSELVASDAEGRRWQLLEARRARGVAALFAGEADAAIDDLGWVVQAARDEGVGEPGAFPAMPDLIEALVLCGRIDEATSELGELEAAALAQDHPWALAVCERCRGLVLDATGERELAAPAFERALDRLAVLGLPLDEARSRLALGSLRRRARQQGEARRLLVRARDDLIRLGVTPLAGRAEAELTRIGGRTIHEGLTPSEERVAALVARGLSNRQIASELVVSTSTVERHLTRVYAKLGLRSRVELARHLAG